jgi:hypothetical protein
LSLKWVELLAFHSTPVFGDGSDSPYPRYTGKFS